MRMPGTDFSSGPAAFAKRRLRVLDLFLDWSVLFRTFGCPILRGAKGGDFEFVFNWSLVADL
jgi:hypothetical protein